MMFYEAQMQIRLAIGYCGLYQSQLWAKPSEVSTHAEHMGRFSMKFPSYWCILLQKVMQETRVLNDFILSNQQSVC